MAMSAIGKTSSLINELLNLEMPVETSTKPVSLN